MRYLRLVTGGALVAALSLVSIPREASATPASGMLGTVAALQNTLDIQLALQCTGMICPALTGFPYNQVQTSTLAGGTGLYVDDSADTMQLSTDLAGALNHLGAMGSNVVFTAVPPDGLNVTAFNIVMGMVTAGLASVPGLDLSVNGSGTFPFAFSTNPVGGIQANTSSANFPVLGAPGAMISGTLVHLPDGTINGPNGLPDFMIQNLVGQFSLVTTSYAQGNPALGTISITILGAVTMNLAGELTAIPEPASILFVGLGVAGFGLAAQRRKAS